MVKKNEISGHQVESQNHFLTKWVFIEWLVYPTHYAKY